MRILRTPEDVAELRTALAVRAASGWAVWDGPERVSGLGPEGFDVVPAHDGALARTADGSRLWRVVAWDERRGAIRLKVRGAFGLVTRTLRIGGEPSAVHAGDWFEEAAGRTLALRFGGECGSLRVVGQRLSGSVRTHGGRQASVIGIGPDASERLVDDALSAGLVARRRLERSSRSAVELLVLSTAPAIRTVAERLVWLAPYARVRLVDVTEPLVDVRPHDQGSLVPGGRAFWPNPAKAELKAERTRSPSKRKRRTPERDLAAVVRARLDVVDPSIDPSLVYEQVPARRRGADGYIDMLCVTRRGRLVVIELKATDFKPEHLGQLGFYLTAVDVQMKAPEDAPTIGLLLCKSKNKVVAEYALRNVNKPLGVADYQLVESLPPELQTSLPSIEQIERELGGAAGSNHSDDSAADDEES